ncbi:ABC transporter substrate-binding protein [Candidatus Pacearchaeota archaeon]|nr:ABC transporter substrate-binding protein [Candidatus Pacearchaeota archaeon]
MELANYAYNDLGARRVAVLRQNTPFGVEHTEDFKKVFEALGGEVVAEESFALTESDVKTEIVKVMEKNPDTIFNLHATGPMLGVLMKQAIELGVEVNWISSFGAQNGPLIKTMLMWSMV